MRRMARHCWLLGCFASIGLLGVACGGSGLSEGEALEGAKAFLDENAPFCAPLPMLSSEPPWVVAEHDPRQPYPLLFEQLGLLASRPTTTSEKGYSALGSSRHERPAREFSLTPEARSPWSRKPSLAW